MSLILKVKRIHPDAILPKYAHEWDSGMDLCACGEDSLMPGESKLFGTGLQVEIPRGYEMQIRPKSGLALKYRLTVLYSPGTVDSGYRGEVGVILINHGKRRYVVKKGEKIAQGVISKVEAVLIEGVENLSGSSRGEGGFGSTG
jgi:dUTP pyrophosphatase